MSKNTTTEYMARIRERYLAMKTKRAKGKVLDEFCETTGLERKHAPWRAHKFYDRVGVI